MSELFGIPLRWCYFSFCRCQSPTEGVATAVSKAAGIVHAPRLPKVWLLHDWIRPSIARAGLRGLDDSAALHRLTPAIAIPIDLCSGGFGSEDACCCCGGGHQQGCEFAHDRGEERLKPPVRYTHCSFCVLPTDSSDAFQSLVRCRERGAD